MLSQAYIVAMDAKPADNEFANLPLLTAGDPLFDALEKADEGGSGSEQVTADSPVHARAYAHNPAPGPAGRPAVYPARTPLGSSQGQALVVGLGGGLATGWDMQQVTSASPAGPTVAGADWELWWGTFHTAAGARLHVWRCSTSGLNIGEAVQVMTVEDARRLRLDDLTTARGYLRSRFGPGRYRIAPRTDQGAKLPGTQSFLVALEEGIASMPVPLVPVASVSPTAVSSATAYDRETAIEIERMRLQAELESDRESRQDRLREQREERRREREAERERRREVEQRRRDDDELRRAERDMQMHTMMVQVLKEVAGGRSQGKDDVLLTAVLAKMGQPDPLVLKLLDTHGKREELTDFFKIQAESMRMASTLQTDSLKQVMTASQEVQSHLLRQAAEVAASRDGGSEWDGIGTVMSATANIISALRNQSGVSTIADPPTVPPMPLRSSPPRASSRPHPSAPSSPSVPPLRPAGVDSIIASLRITAEVQRGARPDDDASVRAIAASLHPDLAGAIRAGDVAALQRVVLPAVQLDPSIGTWLGQPGVGDWLTIFLQRLRADLDNAEPDAFTATPAASDDDDAII